ncbi:MAG: Ccs1/ResB-related putative cytochrome C-type biogenesis protein [uncultured Nocardioidaceae bacterium]|uniref:Ccs1/ResB-related putative cytochrome C-type biogenesis protein n=1 Tax=uncultured Nocardioidaceae bacterium TaxID=253824 RepID=A0A6J4MMN7_9ACTN|nr:MAG: Ccs1/ResB-related putative cytochrome C-type biogenesis protein [uncultured Nocardioidaceae bacterium]
MTGASAAPSATSTRPEESTDFGSEPPGTPPGRAPGLSPFEFLRWAWRQLTSMRTALLLLLLLALAAIPGSVVPQADVAAVQVSRWKEAHPDLAPIYERLGLFSVYDSPWFSAIYLLLMVSLVGCILPRTAVYARSLRVAPPKAPRNLGRLPAYLGVQTDEAPDVVLDRARAALRRRRYRVVSSGPADGGSVAAERGYLREAGNLLFHVSVIVVLVGFAYGQLLGYKGGSIVLVGKGFANSLTQYDDFAPGSFYDPADLQPMSLTVDSFEAEFLRTGPQRGQPVDFGADVTYRETPSAEPRRHRLAVNHPLVLDEVSVFLVGHGYAPVLTVRDGNGDVAYSGPVVFLPQDASFASFGVLKVPDAQPEQLGFDGMFFPTYNFTMARGPFSVFPDALNPALSMLAYSGDLGMDEGAPQSVFELDTDQLEKVKRADQRDFRLDLAPGRTVRLPDGLGSVRFDGWQRWVKLQISDTPGKAIALTGMVLALVGLMGSLFIRRRRVWVRVTSREGGSYVEVAGLDRSGSSDGLVEEISRLADVVVPAGEEERLR